MKYKEFVDWCNKRACDGCWGALEAMVCISVMQDVHKEKFWRRERVWKEKFEQDVLKTIVNPIEKKIIEVYGGGLNE